MTNTKVTKILRSYPDGIDALEDFHSVDDAVREGLLKRKPFDVIAASGAVLWSWAMRPDSHAFIREAQS
jgi:hypothetical protein